MNDRKPQIGRTAARALQAVGDKGLSIEEIMELTDRDEKSVGTWYCNEINKKRRYPEIQRVGTRHFIWVGPHREIEAKPGRVQREDNASPRPKAAPKTGRKRNVVGEDIIKKILSEAGPEGMTYEELAQKIPGWTKQHAEDWVALRIESTSWLERENGVVTYKKFAEEEDVSPESEEAGAKNLTSLWCKLQPTEEDGAKIEQLLKTRAKDTENPGMAKIARLATLMIQAVKTFGTAHAK